jgi:hypothetical protein
MQIRFHIHIWLTNIELFETILILNVFKIFYEV